MFVGLASLGGCHEKYTDRRHMCARFCIVVAMIIYRLYQPMTLGTDLHNSTRKSVMNPFIIGAASVFSFAPDISLKKILARSLPCTGCMALAIFILSAFPGHATRLSNSRIEFAL